MKFLLSIILITGCSKSKTEAGAPTEPKKSATNSPAAPATPQVEPAEWSQEADLDGDGKVEKISYVTTGGQKAVFTVVGASGPMTIEVDNFWEPGGEGPEEWVANKTIKIVDTNRADKAKEIWLKQSGPDGEDPSDHHTFVTFDGTLLTHFSIGSGGYSQGTISWNESLNQFSVLDGHCQTWTTTTYTFREFKLNKIKEETKTDKNVDPSQCAACPFVYVLNDGEWKYQGEILRNLRRKSLERSQTLHIRNPGQPKMKVRITEEKEETTYLDQVALKMEDGTKVLPDSCKIVPSPKYCEDDGQYHVIRQGERLELSFDKSAGTLWANGYYVPKN